MVELPYPFASTIQYGVKWDYSAPAQMYIKPQSQSAKSAAEDFGQKLETTLEVLNAGGSVIYSVQVISIVHQSHDSSELTFHVDGGFSFALAIDTRQNSIPEGLDAAFGKGKALHELTFRNKSLDPMIEDWMNTDASSGKASFFVINNPGSERADLVGKLIGDKKFTSKKSQVYCFRSRTEWLHWIYRRYFPATEHTRALTWR